jgi:hypothetical protein
VQTAAKKYVRCGHETGRSWMELWHCDGGGVVFDALAAFVALVAADVDGLGWLSTNSWRKCNYFLWRLFGDFETSVFAW